MIFLTHLSVSVILLLTPLLHPFHVSVVDVKHSEENKALQITVRIFVDDLEQAIQKESGVNVDYSKSDGDSKAASLLESYVRKRFDVVVDGKARDYEFLGFESRLDVVQCYIEVEKVRKFNSVKFRDTILMEVFDDQVNLIHFKYRNETKSLKLDGKTPEGVLRF